MQCPKCGGLLVEWDDEEARCTFCDYSMVEGANCIIERNMNEGRPTGCPGGWMQCHLTIKLGGEL